MFTVTYDREGKDVLLTATGWEILDKSYETHMEPGTVSHITSCNKMDPLICFHDVVLRQQWDLLRTIYMPHMQFSSVMFKSTYQQEIDKANSKCASYSCVSVDHIPFYAEITRSSSNTIKCVRNIKVLI